MVLQLIEPCSLPPEQDSQVLKHAGLSSCAMITEEQTSRVACQVHAFAMCGTRDPPHVLLYL